MTQCSNDRRVGDWSCSLGHWAFGHWSLIRIFRLRRPNRTGFGLRVYSLGLLFHSFSQHRDRARQIAQSQFDLGELSLHRALVLLQVLARRGGVADVVFEVVEAGAEEELEFLVAVTEAAEFAVA